MPAIHIDQTRLDANIDRFHQASTVAGVRVRAHLKAHRTIELARRQVDAGAIGVATQTAHAARRLAAAGITDVVLAWPWPAAGWRFQHYAETATLVPRFAVHVATAEAITGIGAAAAERGTEVGLLIDLRHTPHNGVLALATLAASTPGVRLDGVSGYQAPQTTADIRDRHEFGRRSARQVVAAAELLRAHGLACPVVSVGGTPTATGAGSVEGVTELCAGAYATLDGGLAAAGAGTPDQVAISVATDAADLLSDCAQPWAPEVTSLPAPPPHLDRLLPAHICPLAVTLVRRQLPITVVDGDRPVATWQPFAAPDRE